MRIGKVASAEVNPGNVVLRVRACGVCHTDLHMVEDELAPFAKSR